MIRTFTLFHAKVLGVELIGRRELELTPVDVDPLFAVTIHVERVGAENQAIKDGETRYFGVHSVARTFGSRKISGKTLHLQAEWMVCDGAFRRFLGLSTVPPNGGVEEFEGWLELGHRYRTDVKWVAGEGLTIERTINYPEHHDGGIDWANLDDFPDLPRDGTEKTVVFELVSVQITSIAEWHWLSIYVLKLIEAR